MEPGSDDERPADTALHSQIRNARPELDTVVRAVMRANASRTLFGTTTIVQIGRYELVREIGTGGGGSVFLARDPELRRDIAMKLIATPDPTLRARALAEGQALARLAHPNIVPVFDVGVVDDRVYLVMELVPGESLRALAERAPVRDVIRAYRQAGEGLVAAHDAGLIHRDFKPDNAVIAKDGRVRIVDFGLADVDGADTKGGTPRYLAPEASHGAAATPAIDQYAFAIALAESVTRSRGSLPRWLEPIVQRGSHAEPAKRFPSMRELLRALARDPRTRWTRRALIATPLALAAVGFAVGRRADTVATPACDDGVAALAPAWTPERERIAHDHVLGLDTPFAIASAPRLRAQLTSYANRWISSRNAACIAARTEPSTALIDRRSTCLASARNQLGTTIDVLSAVEASALSDALRAVSELPAIEHCDDPASLRSDVAPPSLAERSRVDAIRAAIDRAHVLTDAARPDAVSEAAAAVADARALGYRPVLASALLLHGRAMIAVGQRAAAIAPLAEAVELAIVLRDDRVAVEAFARLMLVKLGTTTPALILAELRPILLLAQRLGPRDRFPVALLHNHAGVIHLADGHPERARAEQTTALELARGLKGPGAVELTWVRSNLARVTTDATERAKLHREAVSVAHEHLGADHPISLNLEIGAALGIADRTQARGAARLPFQRLVALHPHQAGPIVDFGYELALLDLADGDRGAARATFAAVIAADAKDANAERIAVARAYQQLLDGHITTARSELARLAKPPAADAPWFALVIPADIEMGRALAAPNSRERRTAVGRAIAYLERAGAASSLLVAQRLAWARELSGRD